LLGVVNVDLYAEDMNFIFGEAEYRGNCALISVYRLRPEFYGQVIDKNLFVSRIVKEAVHEVGHLWGLKHCRHPTCVMYFSKHIGITDKKNHTLCHQCRISLVNM
jgi:archaemetzincin